MRAKHALFVFILSVFTALSATAAAIKGEVVTNVAPALSATMALTGGDASCYYWTVSGKVRPEFRGPGANVHLVCTRYDALSTGTTYSLVFGAQRCTADYCPPGNVDDCGNFSFTATTCGLTPQLDPSYVCNFIVHVDGAQSPQSCNDPHEESAPGGPDPNGTAPCAGGLCPGSN